MLSRKVGKGKEVMFDITHGLRHLPLIGLIAAILIQSLRNVRVSAVWYGAFDMSASDGSAPVLNLAGVLELVRWIQALSAYDASGDLQWLGPVLRGELDADAARQVRKASFFEQTLRFKDAQTSARRVLAAAERFEGPIAMLFQGELKQRLHWSTCKELADAQCELAREHLFRRNLQAASIVGYEAALSWLMTSQHSPLPAGGDPYDAKAREIARDQAVEAVHDTGRASLGRAFHDVRMIRNWLAHGDPPKRKHIAAACNNPDEIEELLRSALNRIFEPT